MRAFAGSLTPEQLEVVRLGVGWYNDTYKSPR
jgi:hypothetical protein